MISQMSCLLLLLISYLFPCLHPPAYFLLLLLLISIYFLGISCLWYFCRFVDGREYGAAQNSCRTPGGWYSSAGSPGACGPPFNQPFRLLLNVAVGGLLPNKAPSKDTVFPQTILVRRQQTLCWGNCQLPNPRRKNSKKKGRKNPNLYEELSDAEKVATFKPFVALRQPFLFWHLHVLDCCLHLLILSKAVPVPVVSS